MNIIRRGLSSVLESGQRVRRDDRAASFIAELALAAPPKDLATLKAAGDLCDRSLHPSQGNRATDHVSVLPGGRCRLRPAFIIR